LRGFRTGAFDGDRLFATSAELRVPVTSVLSGARLGMTAFFDAGRIWDVERTFDSAEWHRGAGAGLFLIASIVKINVDIARGLKTGGTRVHLSGGFAF
jgi:outer membrane protein assembly factor BamA